MRPVILNGNNLVLNNANNDTYKYKFPVSASFKDVQIAVGSVTLYYSWDNITSANTSSQYNNNQFNYIWIDGLTYNVILQDGMYEYEDIFKNLQYVMIKNGHYLVNDKGENVYFLEMLVNAVFYSIMLNTFAVPTSLPSGWTNPAGMSFPATTKTPQFIILPTNNFYKVIGFTPATYPTLPETMNYSVLSDLVPEISPVVSLIMTCNIISNKYSVPPTLLYTFPFTNYKSGELITIIPSQLIWTPVSDGSFQDFEIQFLDQNLNKISIRDTNICINLVFAKISGEILK